MSGERRFVDTNVLVYLFDDDEPGKQGVARSLLGGTEGAFVLSAQVLGEFAAGADTLLTEDLQDGQDFDGVRVRDPFAGS